MASDLRIYPEYNGETYVLMADDGRMSATPCGARLFRAEPHPRIAFTHDSIEAAEADAQKLRAYLAGLPTKRGPKKRTAESAA